MEAMSFDDPRIAAIYDIDNPDGPDHDFFRALAGEAGARTIVDLGCGTGILTVTLAAPGRRIVGIDPTRAMLDHARRRPGGELVEWRLGTADQIPQGAADLVLMTGNVAMHIVGDEWSAALSHISAGLKPGGILAFESRNPAACAWKQWHMPPTRRQTPVGLLRESLRTDPPNSQGVVVMHCRNEFLDDGDTADFEQRLQFRSYRQLCAELSRAGLTVRATYRDWRRSPFEEGSVEPLMVFVAERSDD